MKLTINGREITAAPGQTIYEAAASAGIEIPTLCHHPDLTPVGSCRLCLVEVDGSRAPFTSCTHPTADGLVVHTETPDLVTQRRTILEFLLADYDDSGYADPTLDETEFEKWARRYGARRPEWGRPAPRFPVDSDPNPFVWIDLNKCILCTRCVRACDEVQGCFVWGVDQRGRAAKIVAGADVTMLDAGCESCGACAAYCPTGALDDRMSLHAGGADRLVTTTCGYCGVGCQFDLNVKPDPHR